MFQSLTERFECERRVLSSLLLGGTEAYRLVPPFFHSDCFEATEHRLIFKAISESAERGEPFHRIAITKRLPRLADLIADITKEKMLADDQLTQEAERLFIHRLIPASDTSDKEREESPATINGIPSTLYSALIHESTMVTVNSAQDFVDGVFYYAVKIEDKLHLLNSERKLIPSKKQSDYGIRLSASEVDMCRFSSKGILEFLEAKKEVNPFELFGEIKKYVQRFILLKDIDAYSFLALWAMGTYVFRVFRYFPYVHLNGEKQTGKTLLMEILAPLCFNGQLSINSTEAVLFRDVQNNSLTLFLDEVEKFRNDDRERYGAVMDVLKTGFSKSGLVKRCGGRNRDKIHSFSTYSPKMLAGINDIEEVLRDRTIRIRMVRRLESEPVERYAESRATQELQNRIRDKLYIFGLTYGKQIAEIYSENMDSIVGLEHLNNRAFDVWAPIILLANVVDVARGDSAAKVTDAIKRFSKKRNEERSDEDGSDNNTVKLLMVLNQFVEEVNPVKIEGNVRYFDTGETFGYFCKQEEFSWLSSKTLLTRNMKKLEISPKVCKVAGKSTKLYKVDLDKLRDYSLRYIPSADESVTVTEAVTPVFAE